MSKQKLDAATASKLIELLSTDDAFRASFARDPATALRGLGAEETIAKSSADTDGSCLTVTQLASKEELQNSRELLQSYLTSQNAYNVVFALEAGEVQSKLALK